MLILNVEMAQRRIESGQTDIEEAEELAQISQTSSRTVTVFRIFFQKTNYFVFELL